MDLSSSRARQKTFTTYTNPLHPCSHPIKRANLQHMKIGLLQCDHVNIEYQSQFGDYSDMFQQLFREWEFETYDVINGQFPQDVEACTVYVATGSRHSAYEDLPWINQLKQFILNIQQAGRYFIGICFGHQILAEALGGKVEKSKQGWCVGVHELKIIHPQEWMRPFQQQLNLLMMCQDQVVQLPLHATHLAQAKQCPNAMFVVDGRLFGVQAHPEFSKQYDQLLMEKRVERMGEDTVNNGISSLKKELDAVVLRDWLMQLI